MEKIGIVGAGLIGSSWSAIFSSKGFDVVIYDSNKNVENEFKKRVATFLEELKFIDNKINIEDSLQNIKFVNDIIKNLVFEFLNAFDKFPSNCLTKSK